MALLPEISPSLESRFCHESALPHSGGSGWNGDSRESLPGVRNVQWEAQIRRKGYPAQRKTFETKSDAQAWAPMIESEIDRGIFVSRVEAERTAFHQLIDRYISDIAPKHKGAYSEYQAFGSDQTSFSRYAHCCDSCLLTISRSTPSTWEHTRVQG